MAKDSDVLSVSACARLVGKHPPQLYKYIEAEGMPAHRDSEGHVRVVLGEVKDFLAKREATPRARNVEAATVDSIEGIVTSTFVRKPVLTLWDRGSDHGWAVAAVAGVSEVEFELDEDEESGRRKQRLVHYKVDYTTRELTWPSSLLVEQVLEGKMVVAEPQAVLTLLATQLSLFDPDERPINIIEKLRTLAEELEAWKAERMTRHEANTG